MTRIVTGSFEDFADAARGVSALMDRGFAHGEISIIAVRAREGDDDAPSPGRGEARPWMFVVAAIGAMIGSGSALAWAPPDAGAWVAWASTAGALAGVGVGILVVAMAGFRRRAAQRGAEAVSVVVDDARAARVEAILRAHGATLERGIPGRRLSEAGRSRTLRVVPFRP